MVLTNRRIMQLKAPGFAEIQRAAEMGQPPTSMADLPAAKVSWAVSWQVGSLANHAVRSGHRQDVCLLVGTGPVLAGHTWAPVLYLRQNVAALYLQYTRGHGPVLAAPSTFLQPGVFWKAGPCTVCLPPRPLSRCPCLASTRWHTAVQPSSTPDSLLEPRKI